MTRIFIFIFLLVCCFMLPQNVFCKPSMLCIADDAKKMLLSVPVSGQCGFAIRYKHSVALTPVTDFFKAKAGQIVLDKTQYQDFGAGLPHETLGSQVMKHKNGMLEISGFNIKMDAFDLRIGRVASHQLIIFDEENNCLKENIISLDKISLPGTAVTFYMCGNL